MVISAIIAIDLYDTATGRNTDGQTRLRYLAGTEAGELYMIAINLSQINQYFHPTPKIAKDKQSQDDCQTQIVCIEFLGARLSSCSSLLYLSNAGLIYYTSNSGDSYILRITSEPNQETQADEVGINPSYNEELG